MKRKPLVQAIRFVILALALLAFWGCRARTQTTLEVPRSSVAKEMQARGYRLRKSFAKPPTDWEVSKFRMRSCVIFAFKAEQPLPERNDTYYRFSLIEETYDSASDAQQRLAQLHDEFPDGPREDEYTRALREGFIVDRTLYILQTDAAMFEPELHRLIKALAASRTSH